MGLPLLLRLFPVTGFHDAIRCIEYYSYRYHFVLKSGCRVEEASRIRRALSTYCIVAWCLLWLKQDTIQICYMIGCWRHTNGSRYIAVFTIHQHHLLSHPAYMTQYFGGFLGRKCDGEPGVKTIWRGMSSLHHISSTWKLAHSVCPILVDTWDYACAVNPYSTMSYRDMYNDKFVKGSQGGFKKPHWVT